MKWAGRGELTLAKALYLSDDITSASSAENRYPFCTQHTATCMIIHVQINELTNGEFVDVNLVKNGTILVGTFRILPGTPAAGQSSPPIMLSPPEAVFAPGDDIEVQLFLSDGASETIAVEVVVEFLGPRGPTGPEGGPPGPTGPCCTGPTGAMGIGSTGPMGPSGGLRHALITFASGESVTLIHNTGAADDVGAVIGFGSSFDGVTPAEGGNIILTASLAKPDSYAFPVALTGGALNQLKVYFTNLVGTSIPSNGVNIITEIYYQVGPPNNTFSPAGAPVIMFTSGFLSAGIGMLGTSFPVLGLANVQRLALVCRLAVVGTDAPVTITGNVSASLSILEA